MPQILIRDLIGRVVTRDCDNELYKLVTVERPSKVGQQPLWVIKQLNSQHRIHKIEWDNFAENYTIAKA